MLKLPNYLGDKNKTIKMNFLLNNLLMNDYHITYEENRKRQMIRHYVWEASAMSI